MPDPITPPATGETPPADPPATPPADPPADPPKGDEHDPARAKALIDKLRAEEKAGKQAAKERDELKARLDAIEAEKLTEAERVQKERDEARAEADAAKQTLREQALRLAVYDQAGDLGIASPNLAVAALDRTKVEFDADGQPTNVAALLADLIEREPILKGTPAANPRVPSTDGGAGAGDKAPDLTADELDAARELGVSPEQYQAAKARLGGGRTINVLDAAAALTTKG